MSEAQSKKLGLTRKSSKTPFINDIFESKDNDDVQNPASRNDNLDVIITFLPKNEKELIPNLRVQLKDNNDVDFCDLIKTIRSMGFPVEKNMIYYHSPTNDLNVFCGKDPLPPGTVIPGREIMQIGDKNQISIRIRQNSYNQSLNADLALEAEASKADSTEAAPNNTGGKHKRTKERKIGQVIDKVLYWRKLYTGYNDPNTGQLIKMSLEEAANKVGISKKSLDDYLLQIRFGKKFGFNFNDHYNDRVGVLRAFVKKNKGSGKSGKAYFDDAKMPFEMEQLFDKKDKDRIKGEVPAQEKASAPNLSSKSKKISK